MAKLCFLCARRFADQQYLRARLALAEDRLAVFPLRLVFCRERKQPCPLFCIRFFQRAFPRYFTHRHCAFTSVAVLRLLRHKVLQRRKVGIELLIQRLNLRVLISAQRDLKVCNVVLERVAHLSRNIFCTCEIIRHLLDQVLRLRLEREDGERTIRMHRAGLHAVDEFIRRQFRSNRGWQSFEQILIVKQIQRIIRTNEDIAHLLYGIRRAEFGRQCTFRRTDAQRHVHIAIFRRCFVGKVPFRHRLVFFVILAGIRRKQTGDRADRSLDEAQ
ncbi:hypothetical protein SDC9_116448 [bioreactor metagenome]|uniref:Uncharacterized protein n=1 Tax=bioreactor metagenome TaxID=1076179 RepID=A0A645C2C4_9ZZZZ